MRCWPQVLLGEVLEITCQRDPSDWPTEEFSYIDIGSIDNETKAIVSTRRIVGADAPSRARKVVHRGDIIVSTVRPNLNAVAQIPPDLHESLCSTGFAVLRPSRRLSSRFLYAFVRSPRFVDYLIAKTRGASYPAVSEMDVLKAALVLPPLDEQERIVKVLDQADELRRLRREADRRTAEFIPALFYDMFGDPATNPKGWPVMALRDVADRFSDGPFGSNLKSSHYTQNGVRVVRLQNIGVGYLIDEDRTYIATEHFGRLRKHECLPGDVLVGTLGDPNLRACILPPEIPQALNKADCVQIRPNRNIANIRIHLRASEPPEHPRYGILDDSWTDACADKHGQIGMSEGTGAAPFRSARV